jgi:hypothetical protein
LYDFFSLFVQVAGLRINQGANCSLLPPAQEPVSTYCGMDTALTRIDGRRDGTAGQRQWSKPMDKNLKAVLVFTMLYGIFAVGALWAHPPSASLRIADGVGNLEPDPVGAIHLALANAE